MIELQNQVKSLLADGSIDLFIGYEKGTRLPRPLFVRDADDADKLLLDDSCTGNLAVYLTHKDLVGGRKVGLAASFYALRSIARLFDEEQLSDGALRIFTLDGGALKTFATAAEVKQHIASAAAPDKKTEDDWVHEIEAMAPAERWQYWVDELSKCIRCYACRAACPLCYCTRCIAEVNRPQWLQPWAATVPNIEWQINRVMHLAGRCSDCGACGAACPLGLPIHILSHKIFNAVGQHFGSAPDKGNVLSTFTPDDKENFII